MLFGRSLSEYLTIIPAVLIAIMVHEVSHGFAAYLMGDDTAKEQGRLNFNPVNHIDPIGFLCMIIAGFGWAKPVPINLANMKNRKAGMVVTALAGPLSNFILAFFCFLIVIVGNLSQSLASNAIFGAFSEFMKILANLSIGLGVFNLIPVPPLDGSNIIFPFLPNRVKKFMYEYGQYIQFALLALLMFNFLDGVLYAMRGFVFNGILNAVIFIVELFV